MDHDVRIDIEDDNEILRRFFIRAIDEKKKIGTLYISIIGFPFVVARRLI